MKGASIFGLLALILLLGGFLFYSATSNPQTIASRESDVQIPVCKIDTQALLNAINVERISLGRQELAVDSSLQLSATNKLDDMYSKNYYGHNLPDGRSWDVFYKAQGIKAVGAENENIGGMSEAEVWKSFKGSPSHYSSLTDTKFSRVGIASKCQDITPALDTANPSSGTVGTTYPSLTVVHLAGIEPVAYDSCVTMCVDDWCSPSSGSGTCSHHRGIKYY